MILKIGIVYSVISNFSIFVTVVLLLLWHSDNVLLYFWSLLTHMSTAVPYPACPASMEHSMISGAR